MKTLGRFACIAWVVLIVAVSAPADDGVAGIDGGFAAVLEQARTMAIPAELRLTPDRDRYVNDLAESGYLDALDITREQAGDIYDVLAERAGVTPRPAAPAPDLRDAPAPPSAAPHYRAEFDPQTDLYLRWPVGQNSYLPTYDGLIREIGEAQSVAVIVSGAAQESTARTQLTNQGISLDNVRFEYWPTDTIWTRDYGPAFVGLGGAAPYTDAVIDMSYSRPWRTSDDQIPTRVGADLGLDVYATDFVEDGGNLLTDGRGTCFATSYMFDNNPGWTQQQIEDWFAQYLGCEQLIMPEPLLNEGTGHIDMFVKVVGPHTVMVGEYPNSDANYQRLEDAADLIADSTALDGTPYTVVRVPQRSSGSMILPVFHTYTNGMLTNGKALVPQYNLAEDTQALSIYESLFPDRDTVGIDAAAVIQSGGALHCITMERQDYSSEPTDDDDTDDDSTDDDSDDDSDDDTWHDDDANDDDDAADDDAADDDDASSGGDDDDDGGNCGC